MHTTKVISLAAARTQGVTAAEMRAIADWHLLKAEMATAHDQLRDRQRHIQISDDCYRLAARL